ncbi:hypothetical protein GCM10029963_72510 [Micromonospora andamanensis]|uniref:hypothetical protein n=1 Tax=Micromonospora andamanensis TaxID=1287068 RepID=UPI001A4A5AB6|nr:hypothetical protein [Micromonospora andamanensis]GIJ39695.1 hypothetical protein Vwe01_30200 [Micromonospora andamanensis]
MTTWLALLIALVAVVSVTAATPLVVRRRRVPRPMTRQQRLAAAAKATRELRRSAPRRRRGSGVGPSGVPDRHSAAIAENATYGDAAGFGGGGAS